MPINKINGTSLNWENIGVSGDPLIFVDSTLGPGVWHDLLENTRNLLVLNSQTFIDDMKNIEDANVNLSELTNSNKPTLLTRGEISPQFFQIFVDYLEQELELGVVSIIGAGHSPHISHPGDYASVIKSFHFQYNQSIN